ncbi:UNVERIFIED_ORG: hypothetical protein LHJ69_03700 [Shinella sp. XGS7]|nr:hypothetical protein [Shinella sp. XGS7]
MLVVANLNAIIHAEYLKSECRLTHLIGAVTQVKTPSACMGSSAYIAKHSMQSMCEQRLPGGAEETNKAKLSESRQKNSVTLSPFAGTWLVPVFIGAAGCL